MQGKGGIRPSRGLSGFAAKPKRTEQKNTSKGKGFGADDGLLYNRKPSASAACPCGSSKAYGECCSSIHEGTAHAQDPSELVRARYSAYATRDPDFLMSTTDPDGPEWATDSGEWKRSLLGFCDDFEFQQLDVGDAAVEAESGTVSFRAHIAQKGTVNLLVLCEKSRFRKDASGRWLYTDGDVTYEAQE